MPHIDRQFVVYGWLCAAALVASACAPKSIPPMTVEDLIEDRVTLDGVLLKCNQNIKSRNDIECANARVAVERLSHDVDPADEAKRSAEFERQRERLRLTEERARQVHEAETKVDAYNLPVVPVDAVPTVADSATALATSQSAAAAATPAMPRQAQTHP